MNRIKKFRTQLGWSQSFLAKKAGITPAAINVIESQNRDIRLSTAVSLAHAMMITVDTLAGVKEHTITTNWTRAAKAETTLQNIKLMLEVSDE